MMMLEKMRHIGVELKGHAPFTILGALAGIFFMLIFRGMSKPAASTMFSIFHPGHVLLSAMVTASMFGIHRKGRNFFLILVIGYAGSIGMATLSDSIIPYFGESILGLHLPSHAQLHAPGEQTHEEPKEQHRVHLGFIEDWYIVNPAAVLGVLIAYFLPRTKFPHAGHVLLSTWASSAHILMNMSTEMTASVIAGVFVILFIAVWLPCCISDIVFPLLFVRSDIKLIEICDCKEHKIHSHPHEHEHTEKCPEGSENEKSA